MGRRVLVSLTNCGEVAREGVEVTLSAQRPTASGNSIVGGYELAETTDESGECVFEDVVTGIRLDVKFDGKWVRSVVVPGEAGDVYLASLWGTSGQETDTVAQAIGSAINSHNDDPEAHADIIADAAAEAVSGAVDSAITTHNQDESAHPDLTAFYGQPVTTASYTLAATDDRRYLHCNRGAGVTVTLPGDLDVGLTVEIVQTGDGQVTFTAGSGATLRHPDGHTKTRSKWSVVGLRVIENLGGNAAEYLLSGDTAA